MAVAGRTSRQRPSPDRTERRLALDGDKAEVARAPPAAEVPHGVDVRDNLVPGQASRAVPVERLEEQVVEQLEIVAGRLPELHAAIVPPAVMSRACDRLGKGTSGTIARSCPRGVPVR